MKSYEDRFKLIRISLLVTVFVSVLCTSVMLTYASRKTIIITDEDEEIEEIETVKSGRWVIDTLSVNDKSTDVIVYELPTSVEKSDVEISARYDKREITISVDGIKQSYFMSRPIHGNFENVSLAIGGYDEERTVVTFELRTDCICDVTYKDSELLIKLTPISEIEKPVVLIDPSHGGAQAGIKAGDVCEKDITLNIAKELERISADKPYKIVLGRSADVTMSTESRIKVFDVVSPDYYLGIHLSSNIEDVKQFGMRATYNPDYFHNGLENVDFADGILRGAVTATKNRAISLDEGLEEDMILKVMDVPAAVLYAGFLSCDDELKLLTNDDYIKNIAKGISEALDSMIVTE